MSERFRRASILYVLIAAPTTLVVLTLAKVAIVPRVVAFACVGPVPLGLLLAYDPETRHPVVFRIATMLTPVFGLAGAASFLFRTGSMPARGLAALYAIGCVAIALVAAVRFFRRGFGPLHELAIDFGLAMLPVGAVWLFASRSGMPLAGFYEPVVLLTAAHFHYAGFGAPIVIGVAGRMLTTDDSSWPHRIGTIAVCAGVPLTAIGIATTRAVESSSAIVLALGMLLAASVLVRTVARRAWKRSRIAAVLFAISGTSLFLTMALAATFALTGSAGRDGSFSMVVSFERMVLLHGAMNAFGFVTCGLVACTLVGERAKDERA